MKKISKGSRLEKLNGEMIQSLSKMGLNGRAVLAMVNQAEPLLYTRGEEILRQGKKSRFVFFLLEGETEISLNEQGKSRILAKLGPVTTLGEIAFFNDTPATASVTVSSDKPAVFFRLSYEDFAGVIEQFPDVRETLANIGDMRIIRQYSGFIAFKLFMDLIGWPKDRFAVNRAFAEDLENSVALALSPLMGKDARVLEVGDGPGLVSEFLATLRPELVKNLYLQATHLEAAIISPIEPQPSDFSRAGGLRERFDVIIALQVLNNASSKGVDEELEHARRLLKTGGILFAVRSQLVDVRHSSNEEETTVFADLETLVERVWPKCLKGKDLIFTTFLDADLPPEMEWNQALCRQAKGGKLTVPQKAEQEERLLLSLLLDQASQGAFDPEKLHFQWLEWKAAQHGFILEKGEHNPEASFFFQLFVQKKAGGKERRTVPR